MVKTPSTPKVPKAPQMPKAAKMPKPKMGVRAKSLLKVFKPLLLLPVLAIIAVLVYFFVPQAVKIGSFSFNLNFYCLIFIALIAGILLLVVLVRFVGFIIQTRRAKKQEALLGKAEILNFQENLAGRWANVAMLLKSNNVGLYDMPWYLIVGSPDSAAQPLLEGSGLSFPTLEEAQALGSDSNVIDRWTFTNEAVFIDTTGRSAEEFESELEKAEWDVFLTLLAEQRHRCPANGILVLLSAVELADDTKDTRKKKAKQILARLQHIQSRLQVRVPVYLVVTQMKRILGFSEFFSEMTGEKRDQILGWSNPNPPDAPVSPHMFIEAFDGLTDKLKNRQFVAEDSGISPEVANRAALFPEEFVSMKEPLADYVEALGLESRFADSVLFRGFYFTGASDAGLLATLYCKKYLPGKVLETVAPSTETVAHADSFFVKDLFTKKILLEPGLVTRPKSIFRKNLEIKIVAAVATTVFFIVGTLFLLTLPKKTAREIETLEANILTAKAALQGQSVDADMLTLCTQLAWDRKRLVQKGFLARILGLGKLDALDNNLATIHRSVFQENILDDIVRQTEQGLRQWQRGRPRGEPNFHLFSGALNEYIRWSNPNFRLSTPVDILPFLDFLQIPREAKHQYTQQFKIYLDEGGRSRRIVDSAYEATIGHAMETSRIYLRPTLSKLFTDSSNLSNSQWWLKMAGLLQQIKRDYQALLKVVVPDEITTADEMTRRYNNFRFLLNRLHSVFQEMDSHMQAGSTNGVRWVDVDSFYNGLYKTSHGMPTLQLTAEKARQDISSDYNHRVRVPIVRLMPWFHAMEKYPSQSWLKDELVRKFGADHEGLGPDFGIGAAVFDLLNEVKGYDQLINTFQASFETWQQRIPAQIKQLKHYPPPLRTAEFDQIRHTTTRRLQALAELSGQPAQQAGSPVVTTAVGKPAAATKEDQEEEEKKKAIVAYWDIPSLSSRLNRWLEVQDRKRTFAETLYLQELYNRADLHQGILAADSWRKIKTMGIFRKGDGIALAAPVDAFIADWIQSIPQSIRSGITENKEKGSSPELRTFEALIKSVQLLQASYLPRLREGASNFAKCIQAMDSDVGVAWQTLRDSAWSSEEPDQPVSWKNLQSFSAFRESLELEQGRIGENITGQLEAIESHVINTFKKDLIALYQTEWQQTFSKYDQMEIAVKFPFRKDGPQLDEARLLAFFDDLDSLAKHFELEQGLYRLAPDGKKGPIAPVAHGIVKEMANGSWMRFYADCKALETLLFDNRTPRPLKFKASMVPGPAGIHFHWLRIASGDGTIRDLNVYGEPTIEVTMTPKDGSITIHGLDAAKTPRASVVVTEGDHAFLQMVYLFGKPVDDEKKTWLVDIELPLGVNPAMTVKSTFKFVFDESLPDLPNWKDRSE
jgi:hypothetical protein